MDNSKMTEWFRDQLRMAGEELIARSKDISMDGLDCLQDAVVTIRIPTRKERLEIPDIDFTFTVCSKTAIDELCNRPQVYLD